jgi:hypothetical protein
MQWRGHVAHVEGWGIYTRCELESWKVRKKQLARHWSKWEDINKIALEEIGYDVKSIQLIQDSVKWWFLWTQ